MNHRMLFFASTLLLSSVLLSLSAQQDKALTLQDIMHFKQIRDAAISENGKWIVHTAAPDRGDSEVYVYSANGKNEYVIEQADKPVLSRDGLWVAARNNAPALEIENAGKDAKPKSGLVLLNTKTGEKKLVDSVQSYSFSNDGKWLFMMAYSELDKKTLKKYDDAKPGTELTILSLEKEKNFRYPFVKQFEVDSLSKHIAFIVSDTTGEGNALYVAKLNPEIVDAHAVLSDSALWADQFAWNSKGSLAFLAGKRIEKGIRDVSSLYVWNPGEKMADEAMTDSDLPEEWRIYHANNLEWTYDCEYLYLGTKPVDEILPPEDEKDSINDLYDTEQILADREVDVWHWDDPYINPHQKKNWTREKNRTYTGIYFSKEGKFVQLANKEMPDIYRSRQAKTLLGYDETPYSKKVTWDGRYRDYYIVDALSGERKMVLEEQMQTVRLSPDGKYLTWYSDGDWFLYDTKNDETRNLTGTLAVPFADEDWDYPADVPGYGIAGWIDGSEKLLIYDKYDIWQFNTKDGAAICLTEGEGRKEKMIYRIQDLKEERHWFKSGEELLLYGYHDMEKYRAIYAMKVGKTGVNLLLDGEKKYSLLSKAGDADQILFNRMTYTEFPDLYVSKPDFKKPLKLSDLGAQTNGFAWGEAELVDWLSVDGRKMQGILIKPGNYLEGKKYPVLVYYYRFFTDRLYNFPDVVVNHRPNFPYFASNGYAIFLPDIRFDVGTPGYAATKSLVPGVQKIIEMGVADPDAIGLHGHSWSGYQTAFVITQTDIFACAIAGAPVSNMTSAYSGIRWGSGLARQFQYEKTQSRIGGNLWEARDKYIENSPVFFADRINTPLLIQFGDKDGAVPWYQGIELYLAMRRLEKDCVFLQYRGEDHHLAKYANKLDYTIKFKEYLDHYLKGEPAADWIKEGVLYKGE